MSAAITTPFLIRDNRSLESEVPSPAPPLPIEVMQHDEVQEAEAFARGTFWDTRLQDDALEGRGTFESEVIAAPFAFTHAVLKWRGEIRGASFEFRTSPDGVTWPDWASSDPEAASVESRDAQALSGLVAAPRHGFLQYRARLGEESRIRQVTAIFLNTKDGRVLEDAAVLATRPHDAIDYSRAMWGCDERLRFREGQEISRRRFVLVRKLVVHHTATPEAYEDSAAEVRAIYTYHARILGWGDIGYHALVDRFGRSFEGRYGRDWDEGREVFSPDVVGAHAFDHNPGSCGVALIGHFHGAAAPPVPPAMFDRLLDVLEHMARLRDIDPLGSSDFRKASGGWNVGLPNVSGHRDCSATACPGDNAYALLGEIRSRLGDRLTPLQPSTGRITHPMPSA